MRTRFVSAVLAAVVLTACASTQPAPPPEVSWDGLELRTGTTLDRVYIRRDATFERYKKRPSMVAVDDALYQLMERV